MSSEQLELQTSAAGPPETEREPLFPYELPDRRIASRPCQQSGAAERSDSRLLVVKRGGSGLRDHKFFDLPTLFEPGDLLLLNDTRVVPYRFLIKTPNGRPYELLLIDRIAGPDCLYRALAKPLRRIRPGRVFELGPVLRAQVLESRREPDPEVIVRLFAAAAPDGTNPPVDPESLIDQSGSVPIPLYIRGGVSDELDRAAYQTVYAAEGGSIAAPTAGLHFTDSVIETLKRRGVEVRFLTLHLGPASFLPVRGDLAQHRMPLERFKVGRETAEAVVRTKDRGGRVIAVGTSTVRTLESLGIGELRRLAGSAEEQITGSTELFITPGFNFTVIDALVTNFHQPGSTHLYLVAAFAGTKTTEDAYNHALAGDYRFLSYGDSMVIK